MSEVTTHASEFRVKESSRERFRRTRRIIGVITNVTGYLGVIAVFVSVLIIVYEVFARYVFHWATVWEIEASIFCIIFTTFVGSAFALKNEAHIRMDILTERLKPSVRQRLSLVTSILALAFCILATIKGCQMWWEAYVNGWRSESLWAPPLFIPYAFLPIGFAAICLQYVLNILDQIEDLGRGKK